MAWEKASSAKLFTHELNEYKRLEKYTGQERRKNCKSPKGWVNKYSSRVN